MAGLRALRLGFALALLVLSISDYATSEAQCRSGCQGAGHNTFKYLEGTTYKYNFEGNIDVALSSAEGQQSGTKIKAAVLLTQLPDCNQLLRLQNVQVIGPDGKKHGHIADIEKPIRFNNRDGLLDDSICVDAADSANSLNIKRAVASIFQAALKHHYETDVFGVCPTEIVSRKDGANIIIQKSRSLNKCSHRENIKQDFMATSFNLNSEIKSSPLLNGEYSAELRIKNGILDHAIVTEEYLYVPFSVGKNGAKASVSTKIQFTGSAKEAPKNFAGIPKSIIFENPYPVTTHSNIESILSALKDVTSNVHATVGEKTAKAFVNLIKILQVSKKDDILAVYGQVRAGAGFADKANAKQVFLDALFQAGTSDAVEVAIELLKNKELGPVEQKLLYLGLAFVKHVTVSSLNAVNVLLDHPHLPREAYLGIGTLAGRYCKKHNCHKAEVVNKLIHKLVSKLGDGKADNRDKENEIIYVLKALANVESLTDAAIAKITSLAQDKKLSNRVRVAGLSAYLADACHDKIRDSALNILKDTQQDSEIRIKAYLAAAHCANGKVANTLKTILEHEPSYQVGAYIISHLRNLKASANPDKELAKHHLSKISTLKKFPIDLRKYSFNIDHSYTADTLGLGGTTELDVIYSQNSFLPRSTSLNLTAEVFGHTFNFLEVGTRQENLDKVLEHYFGPLGVLNEGSTEELVHSGKETLDKIVNHLKNRFEKTRGKRQVSKAEIDSIGKQVQIKTNELNKDVDLDLSVKLFGSELLFLSINDQDKELEPERVIDSIFDKLDAGINKAKNFEKTIQSNSLFIDSEFSYPTSLGFPLRLAVEGSSAIQLKAAGKIDLKALLNDQVEGIPFRLSLIPSANVEVSGSLTVDAQVVEAGLKVTSTLHTATGGDLEVLLLQKGKGLDVKFSLPVQKQKLISATHDIVFNVRELGKPEVNQPIKFGQNKDFSVCVDQLVPFIGLDFCADINSPPTKSSHGVVLPYPFSGNGKFSVSINREDLSHIHFKELVFSDSNKLGVEYTLETFGAKNDKKVGLHIQAFAAPEMYVKADLISPILPLSLEGRVINTNQEKSLSVKLQQEQNQYVGKLGFSVSGNQNRAVYKPLLEYKTPSSSQKLPVTLDGTVVVEWPGDGVKLTLDNLKLDGLTVHPVSLNGNFGRLAREFFTDLTLSAGGKTHATKGKFFADKNSIRLNSEYTNNHNPTANFNLKYELKKSPTSFDSNLQLIHGKDLSSKTNKFTLSNYLNSDYQNAQHYDVKTKNKISYPLLKIEAKFDAESKPKSLDYDLEIHYGHLKIGSELELKVSQKTEGDYDLEFEAYGYENKLELKAKRDITGDKSKIENALVVNGQKLELSGTVTHHFKQDDLNVGADLVIKVPKRADPLKVQSGLICNPNELDTHVKIFSGANVYVDYFVKATNGNNANGNLKVALPSLLSVNGQLRVVNGVGNANVEFELAKLQRIIKAESSFTVKDPVYNVDFTLYPNFQKDNNKIIFSSHNQHKEQSCDSKNYIDYNGHKLELNLKNTLEGEFENGRQTVFVETILPSSYYLSTKLGREQRIVNKVAEGNWFVVLEKRETKNAPPSNINLKSNYKVFDSVEGLFNIDYHVDVVNQRGAFVNLDLGLKRHFTDNKYNVDSDLKISGAVVQKPIHVQTHLKYKDYVGSYQIVGKCEQHGSITINGKYDAADEDRKLQSELNVELERIGKAIYHLKFGGSGLVTYSSEDHAKYNGNFFLFIDDNELLPGGVVDVKLSNEVEVGPNNARVKATANLPKQAPIIVDLGYDFSEANNAEKLTGHASLQYDNGKLIKSDLSVVKPNEHEARFDFKIDLPKSQNNRLQINIKKTPDDKVINGEVILTANNKKYTLSNELVLSELAPAVHVKLILPDGKVDSISAKINKLGEHHYGGELKVAFSENNFVFNSNLDADIESVDNFFLKVQANSPALKINDILFEAQNKAAKGGKRIQVVAKSAGKNLFSGSTNYKAREEGGKYIVEGSGSFKVKEDNKQANFKFVKHDLNTEKNGEDGVEILFNAGLGVTAVDTEFKATNKQFKTLVSYCEEKQQCAHFEVDSKTDIRGSGEFNNEIEVAIDLRKLGLSHEFGLKGVTTRKSFILDHNVDVYFQNKDNKYQYSLYVHPSEAGAQLTTPKRVIALEGKVQVPKPAKGKNSPIRGEVAFYLNKKAQPNQKTALVGVLNCYGQNKGDCHAEVKFTNPALGRDLGVSYTSKYDANKITVEENLIIDVFANANQKIVVTGKLHGNRIGKTGAAGLVIYEAKSQGLNFNLKYEGQAYLDVEKRELKYSEVYDADVSGIKYNTGVILQADVQKSSFVVRVLNKELVNANYQHEKDKSVIIVKGNTKIFGVDTLISYLEVKNWSSFTYKLHKQSTPDNELRIDGMFVLGVSTELHADVTANGAKKELFFVGVMLDEKSFLKTQSRINSKDIQVYFVTPLRNEATKFYHELKAFSETVVKDQDAQLKKFVQVLSKSTPNFKPLVDYYQKELKKLREELVSDKTIKEVANFLSSIFQAVGQVTGEVLGRTSELLEKIVHTLKVQFEKVEEIVSRKIIPQLNEISKKLVQTAAEIFEKVTDVLLAFVAKLTLLAEEHEKEIKRVLDVFATLGQDVARFLYRVAKETVVVVDKEWSQIYQGVQKLPIAEEIKNRYEQLVGGLEVPPALINALKEAIITLKDAVPSPELKRLITVIGDYLEKKLKNENVDDATALQTIARLVADIINKSLSSFGEKDDVKVTGSPLSFLSFDFASNLPKLTSTKYSPLSYLARGEFPSLIELLYAISLHPLHWIPPYKLDAVIVQGQHIFTFDGKHITFPANCKYLLARDAVNGNFTIAATFASGQLSAITYADKHNVVTLKKGGQVLLDNAATEFPVHKPNLQVYRLYESLNLKSKAGVNIICGPELLVCGIHVSGFYHGQLRGLLGNGNSEPYDDFTIPNGKIVKSESEFGNSYKIGANCPPVKTVDHSVHHHNPSCQKLFGQDSPLSICHPFVNPENYKMACSHGLAANVKDTEKAVVLGYVAACRSKFIPVHVPKQFLKCENGQESYDVGDSFSVKTPAKAADIIVAIDQHKFNEPVYKELVQPMISQITTELNAKGINDIEVHLIGYGLEEQNYPSHYTVAGKLTFKGRSPNLKFAEEPKETSSGCPHTDKVIKVLKEIYKEAQLVSGQSPQQKAYTEALKYPFRPNAVKSIIAVVSKPCEEGHIIGFQKLRALLFNNPLISLNLVTPFEHFSVKDAKQTKNVIGFNSHNVFTLTDKKKPEGSPALHPDLEYNDYCVDFTLKNRGNVFVTNNFLHAKGASRKQFAQVAAHNVVSQLVNVEQGLDCECQLVSAFSAQNVCKVAYTKSKTTPPKKGGHKG